MGDWFGEISQIYSIFSNCRPVWRIMLTNIQSKRRLNKIILISMVLVGFVCSPSISLRELWYI